MSSSTTIAPAERSMAGVEPSAAPVAGDANIPPKPPIGRRMGWRGLAIGAAAVVLLGGALLGGTLPRLRQQRAVNAAAAETAAAPPRVSVAVVRRMAPEAERVLPGNCLPLLEAAMYARTTGYVKRRLVDIGDR